MQLELLAAHMVGDYIAQTDWMASKKLQCAKVRALHVTLYVACFLPVLIFGSIGLRDSILFAALLWLTHFITDSRRWASGEKWAPKPIMDDQTIHLVTLAILYRLFLT